MISWGPCRTLSGNFGSILISWMEAILENDSGSLWHFEMMRWVYQWIQFWTVGSSGVWFHFLHIFCTFYKRSDTIDPIREGWFAISDVRKFQKFSRETENGKARNDRKQKKFEMIVLAIYYIYIRIFLLTNTFISFHVKLNTYKIKANRYVIQADPLFFENL